MLQPLTNEVSPGIPPEGGIFVSRMRSDAWKSLGASLASPEGRSPGPRGTALPDDGRVFQAPLGSLARV